MSIMTGAASFRALRTNPVSLSDDQIIDRLKSYSLGWQKFQPGDGVETAWTAGVHILDTDFRAEKNIVNDAVIFSFRISQSAIPADKLKAYYEIDLKALSANNPSGRPSARQKREARESARERLEDEARDGRFLKHKLIKIVWYKKTGLILFGSTSTTQLDRFLVLFRDSFALTFQALTAGELAFELSQGELFRELEDASLSPFIPGITPDHPSWTPDDLSKSFLGNEFLTWLWYRVDSDMEEIPIRDGEVVPIMLDKRLILDCPRGQTGVDGFKSDAPTKLPEARRALQAGKLPRVARVTAVSGNDVTSWQLSAEDFVISGLTLPKMRDGEAEQTFDRIERLYDAWTLITALYGAFLDVRLGEGWGQELAAIQSWIGSTATVAA